MALPGIPTEEELARLQEIRRREASLRVEEEKKQSALAKIKFDSAAARQRHQQQASPRQAAGKKRSPPVKFDTGFVSSLSGNNYVSSDDPIVQQMCNLREFIGQARAAGRHDDARLLEDNLKDLQVRNYPFIFVMKSQGMCREKNGVENLNSSSSTNSKWKTSF